MLKKRWEYPMFSLSPVRIKDYCPVKDTGWQNSTNQSGLGRTVHKIAHKSFKGLPMIFGLNRAGQMLSCLLSMAWKNVSYCSHSVLFDFFFSLTPFFRDKVSESCFTGQLPGIGTVFILASLQTCKVQGQSPLTNQGCWGGGGWGLLGLGGVVQGGRWGVGARHRDCDGGLGPRRGGWLQMLKVPRVWGKLSIWRWGRR